MLNAISSAVCWSVLCCCEGSPPVTDPPAPPVAAVLEIEGIDFDGIRIVGGGSWGAMMIASDDPRLPLLKELGLVKRGPARSWGCEQAAGKPDTEGAGDITTAWASATPDEQDEWLELTYAEEVKPAEIHVVETYNPGALFKVTATAGDGDMEAVLWKGDDPTARDAGRGTSIVKSTAAIKTNKIRIHLASKDVPGWNEIDAVGVLDEAGKMHWPISVTASSNYAGAGEPGWMLDMDAALRKIEELQREVEALRKKAIAP